MDDRHPSVLSRLESDEFLNRPLMSIDIVRCNYSVFEATGLLPSWADLCAKCGVPRSLADSKPFRQKAMGLLTTGGSAKINSFIVDTIAETLLSLMLVRIETDLGRKFSTSEIVMFKRDEFVVCPKGGVEDIALMAESVSRHFPDQRVHDLPFRCEFTKIVIQLLSR